MVHQADIDMSILKDFQNSFTSILCKKIGDEVIIKHTTTLSTRRHTTWWFFFKNFANTEAQQLQIKRAWTMQNVRPPYALIARQHIVLSAY